MIFQESPNQYAMYSAEAYNRVVRAPAFFIVILLLKKAISSIIDFRKKYPRKMPKYYTTN